MVDKVIGFALTQRIFVCVAGLVLLFGGLYAFHVLDVVAYPDPSPPMIEVITQYGGWSAEQMTPASWARWSRIALYSSAATSNDRR